MNKDVMIAKAQEFGNIKYLVNAAGVLPLQALHSWRTEEQQQAIITDHCSRISKEEV